MNRPLAEFVDMLRYADVPVSIGEALDAARTIDLLGYSDKHLLKSALSQVMAKTEDEMASFDACFDTFFSINTELDLKESLSESLLQELENDDTVQTENQPLDALDNPETSDETSQGAGDGGGGGGEGQAAGDASGAPSSSLVEMLENADRAGLTLAMTEAANAIGLSNIVLSTQRGLFTRRILEQMGLDEVTQEINERRKADNEDSAADLEQRLNVLFEATRDMVERQLALTSSGKSIEFRQDVLKKVRLSNIENRDFRIMRDMVQKMAKRLMDMNSRVKKVKNRGHLDISKTIRRSIAYDGLMFETYWKQKEKDRPKVFAVCDVSGSVASVARFLLLFLYSMNEVLPNVRSFAFSGELGEVTDLFNKYGPEEAIPEAIERYGSRSTDYGRALEDFQKIALNEIDNRTTVIILGDGRSNGSDPRVDILREIKNRSKRVIWLNPERKNIWGSGDSEMKRIAPNCTVAEVCNSLNKLELVIRDLLKTS